MTYTIMNNSAVSKEAKILPGTSICLFSMSGVKNLVANSYTSISPRSGDSRGWPGVARATPESSLATPVATPDVIGSW